MTDLTREFLLWIARRPRTYAEAMEAWRSNCPRQSVWEDALLDGFIQVEDGRCMSDAKVTLTALGAASICR